MGHFSGYQYRSGYPESIRKRDNYTCQICGQPGRDIDHIVPWKITHDNSPENLRILCHSCNCKGRHPKHFALEYNDWVKHIQYQCKPEAS